MLEAKMHPLVSILIPAYNSASTLLETLNSVYSQTYQNWELIVVDDGSTDETATIMTRQSDARVRYIHQKNEGLASARNRGCQEAQGDFFSLLDADDIADPDRLMIQVNYLQEHSEIDLCSTNFRAFNADGLLPEDFITHYYPIAGKVLNGWLGIFGKSESWVLKASPNQADLAPLILQTYNGQIYRKIAHGNFIHPPTVMFRRSLWNAVGQFDTRVASATDWEWLVRAARHTSCAFIDRSLLKYRRHPGQATGPIHTLRFITDVIAAQKCICDQDSELFFSDKKEFLKNFYELHTILANIQSNTQSITALKTLKESLKYGKFSTKTALIATKALTPKHIIKFAKFIKDAKAKNYM